MAATWTIDDDIRAVLAQAVVTDRSVTLAGQLDRKLYEGVNKVLEGIGGKWNRRERAHIFDSDPRAKLAEILDGGKAVNEQQKFQAFYTPPDVAARLVAGLGVSDFSRVLEPSAGAGAIVAALRKLAPEAEICAVEINPEMRGRLESADLRVDGLEIGDFLEVTPAVLGAFDVIAMNPPFTKGQDMRHVRHAFAFLGAGGRLAAIMSPGWRFRKDKAARAFREWAEEQGAEWTELPAGAFSESGTEIATGILRVAKP